MTEVVGKGSGGDGAQEASRLDPLLPLLQHADLTDKVVLLRIDHNVVKKGTPHRVDFATIFRVVLYLFQVLEISWCYLARSGLLAQSS